MIDLKVEMKRCFWRELDYIARSVSQLWLQRPAVGWRIQQTANSTNERKLDVSDVFPRLLASYIHAHSAIIMSFACTTPSFQFQQDLVPFVRGRDGDSSEHWF